MSIHEIKGTKEERFAKQAELYQTYFSAILEGGVRSVTFWGTVDNESWFENGYYEGDRKDADALLFDDDLQPEPDCRS